MGPSNTGKFTHQDYTVGWICALPIEYAASTAMFDSIHASLPNRRHDNNTYTLGHIGPHNIVAACLPSGEYGNNSATRVATQMQGSFESIRFGLMVGIGGGIPSEKNDIRLGDIVVSKRTKKKFSGVLQFDYGKTGAGGKFEYTTSLNKPAPGLLTMLSKLEAVHERRGNRISEYLSAMVKNHPRMGPEYTYQGQEHDVLFEAEYEHVGSGDTCKNCDSGRQIGRPARDGNGPIIHYGLIASGNQVIKHAITRDKLREELDGILCFEMEAAGLMDHFPCLVIRGICDYADSHKNKRWQRYAAATAAACAKELLTIIEDVGVLENGVDIELPLENGDEAKLPPEKGDGVGLPYDDGSDIDAKLGYQLSPSRQGAAGHDRIVELSLENGTSTDTSPGHQLSVTLEAASGRGHTVEPLHENKVEVDEELAYQLSLALQADLDYGADHIVEQLLKEAGIDTELRNQINYVLEPALDRSHDYVVEDLLKKEADIDPELRNQINYVLEPASDWSHDYVEDLFKIGADAYTKSRHQLSPSIQAPLGGDQNHIVGLLLESGADVNTQHGNALHATSL